MAQDLSRTWRSLGRSIECIAVTRVTKTMSHKGNNYVKFWSNHVPKPTTVSSFSNARVQERRVRGRRRRAARAESRTHARSLECALGRFQTRPGSRAAPDRPGASPSHATVSSSEDPAARASGADAMRGHRATRAPFGATATAPVTPPGTDVRLEGVSAVVRTAARAESRSPPGDDDASLVRDGVHLSRLRRRAFESRGRPRASPRAPSASSSATCGACTRASTTARRPRRRPRRCASTSASVASAPSARSRGNPEDSLRHQNVRGGRDNRDAVRQAAARALAAGVRRRTPDTAAALAEATRRYARLATERENADADADDGGRRPPRRGGRPNRPPLAPVPPRDAGTFFETARGRSSKTPPTWEASCAISRARERTPPRGCVRETARGRGTTSVRLEMTMAGRRRLSRLGRW